MTVWAAGTPGVIAWMNAMEPLLPTAWVTPTLLNGWVAFGGVVQAPRYSKTGGIVCVEGGIKSGTATAGTQLFALPAGFRPAATISFISVGAAAAVARIDVATTGTVVMATGGDAVFTGFAFVFRASA